MEKFDKVEVVEMTQSVKGWSYKEEDLSLHAQHPREKLGIV